MISCQRLQKTLALGAALTVSVAALLMPATSMAQQVSGLWRVTGDIDGKAFTVNCLFQPQGARLGGVCTDVSTGDGNNKPGKQHKLSAGSVNGSTVNWTYPVKVMIISVDINFTGKLNGNRMAGTISAKGREGHFNASKT